MAISYPVEGAVYLKEAIENDLIDKFLFVDGTKSNDIITAVGADGPGRDHRQRPPARRKRPT